MPISAAKETLDFIVIGAQKAGTTSLFEYLKRHPEIALPVGKEAPYFSHEPARARGWQQYLKRTFAFADPDSVWGTVTTHYMFGALYEAANSPVKNNGYTETTVPLRIREQLPAVRLIALLRDPVQRAHSHYMMARLNGLECRSFDNAIAELLKPRALRESRREPHEATGYVVWGEYGRLLSGYFDVFPAEQILVIFTDELDHEAEQTLRRIYDFIGVKRDAIPDNIGVRYREGSTVRPIARLNPYAVQEMATRSELLRSLWHRMPDRTQRQADRAFAQVAYWADLFNRGKTSDTDSPSAAVESRLREHFAPDGDLLRHCLGRSLPWKHG